MNRYPDGRERPLRRIKRRPEMSKAWKLVAGMLAGAAVLLVALPFALAEAAAPGAAAVAGTAVSADVAALEVKKYIALAAGFCVSFAAFGGALAQGRAASAALEGIARNPNAPDKLFVPMILGLALIESLVIYAFVLSLILQGKI